jgi:hypothetical protein
LLGFGVGTRETLDAVSAKHGDPVISRLVDTSTCPEVDLVNVDRHAHREYGVTEPSLMLILPDGHLVLTAPAGRGEAVLAYLDGLGR